MMNFLFKKAQVFENFKFVRKDLFVSGGRIAPVPVSGPVSSDVVVFDCSDFHIFPGLVDVHVHLREPGFLFKETISTGTAAAARGGYTAVCPMPNLAPAPDSAMNLAPQLEAIKKDARIRVRPYGTITKERAGRELADLEEISGHVVAFSDDGSGVQDDDLMRDAMRKVKALGKIIAAHCEDERLLRGGCVHDGEYAKGHGLPGICSESEWGQIKRDLALVRETGCDYHVCHVSAKESVALIRQAKREGLPVTCETAPHYLVFCDDDLEDDGRFKMNPPIRSKADRDALIEGIIDGTIDMIATDHAPHTAEEKSKGLRGSLMGVVGLETAFPVMYTKLVNPGVITLEKLIDLMAVSPARRFNIPWGLEAGDTGDLTMFDLNAEHVIDSEKFLSKGRSTPFDGMAVYGDCIMTLVGGEPVWQKK